VTKNQTTEIYDTLKEKIISGFYQPSESLTELELANQFGVSRNTVKKALFMLERENLVSIERNKSAKVRSYSMAEVLEFLELRENLEGFIIRKAVNSITEEQLEKLSELLSQMKTHMVNRDLLAYSQCNQNFHAVIYSACVNRTAVEMTLQLKNQMRKYNTKTILIPGRDVQSFAEHTQIYEAIKARDGELAEKLMQHHIFNVRKTFEDNYSLLF